MLQVENSTPLASQLYTLPDPAGVDRAFVVAVGVFDRDGVLIPEAAEIALEDEWVGDPGVSSIRAPSDITLDKSCVDLLVHGDACAPRGEAATFVEVALRIGRYEKSLRVWGDRWWERRGGRLEPTAPKPFGRMPLVWERSFGGPKHLHNPVGIGLEPDPERPESLWIPNIEHPSAPISRPKDAPGPIGFGAIAPHWAPRRYLAGTYDAAWQSFRAPFLPDDYDPLFAQVAPEDQQFTGGIGPGTVIHLAGMDPDGDLQLAIPTTRVGVTFQLMGRRVETPATLDTVVVDATRGTVRCSWRAAIATPPGPQILDGAFVEASGLGAAA